MGWKSTITISRQTAIDLVHQRLLTVTDEELGRMVESSGYGDNIDLAYYGHNFHIGDDANERAEYERLKRKFE